MPEERPPNPDQQQRSERRGDRPGSGDGVQQSVRSQLVRFSAMGVEFVGMIAAGLLVGWWVDNWRGTSPVGTIIGAIAGLGLGGWNFMREALRVSRLAQRDYRRRHPEGLEGLEEDEDQESEQEKKWSSDD